MVIQQKPAIGLLWILTTILALFSMYTSMLRWGTVLHPQAQSSLVVKHALEAQNDKHSPFLLKWPNCTRYIDTLRLLSALEDCRKGRNREYRNR